MFFFARIIEGDWKEMALPISRTYHISKGFSLMFSIWNSSEPFPPSRPLGREGGKGESGDSLTRFVVAQKRLTVDYVMSRFG